MKVVKAACIRKGKGVVNIVGRMGTISGTANVVIPYIVVEDRGSP